MALFSRSLLSKNMHILNTKPNMTFHISVNGSDRIERGSESAIFLIRSGFAMFRRRDATERSLPSFFPSFFPSREATREQLYGGSKARQIARNEERAATAAANKSGVEK